MLAIPNAILAPLRDPTLPKRMGEAVLRAASPKFNLKANAAQFLKLYGISRIPVGANPPGSSAMEATASLAEGGQPWST